TTQIYTLSLHDALPIYHRAMHQDVVGMKQPQGKQNRIRSLLEKDLLNSFLNVLDIGRTPILRIEKPQMKGMRAQDAKSVQVFTRSEEHTSELQSRENLV